MKEFSMDSVESLFDGDYHDARAYHRRALQYMDARQPTSLVFNVASVALERYLVALCELYGVEPMNHNFIGLAKEVSRLVEIPHELSRDIRSVDHIFGICFLENYYHGTPETADMEKVLRLCNEVNQQIKISANDKYSTTPDASTWRHATQGA
jgi:HEPN domain-containing protein